MPCWRKSKITIKIATTKNNTLHRKWHKTNKSKLKFYTSTLWLRFILFVCLHRAGCVRFVWFPFALPLILNLIVYTSKNKFWTHINYRYTPYTHIHFHIQHSVFRGMHMHHSKFIRIKHFNVALCIFFKFIFKYSTK